MKKNSILVLVACVSAILFLKGNFSIISAQSEEAAASSLAMPQSTVSKVAQQLQLIKPKVARLRQQVAFFLHKTDKLQSIYSNFPDRFRMDTPAGWNANQGLTGNAYPIMVFLKPSMEKDINGAVFYSNTSITYEASGGKCLKDYIAKTKLALLENVSIGYVLLEERQVDIGGITAQIIGGTYTIGNAKLRSLQLFVPKGDNVYVITTASLASNWEKYGAEFETDLMSFRFLN